MTPNPPAALPAIRPGRSRRHAAVDALRLREIDRLVAEGVALTDAVWRVLGPDGGPLAYSTVRGKEERPTDARLLRRFSNLVRRSAPELVETARSQALAVLAAAADSAARSIVELAGDDSAEARVRLDAAKAVLAALGVSDRGPLVEVKNEVNVATLLAEKLA